MARQFVSEAIEPVADAMETRRMARGEPGLPRRFRWRDAEHEVAEVLESWRETSRCRHGSPEQYVRKHWYRVRTTDGAEMKLYFERQARPGRRGKLRWWLHSVSTPAEG
jgi:phosphoribosylglycinamide formyltransferase-1